MRIAHEVIYDLHAELVARGTAQARPNRLLAESARITLAEVLALTAEARQLAETWHEQSVLDADAAGRTLHLLADELERIQPRLRRQLNRQRAIARELQKLVEEAG